MKKISAIILTSNREKIIENCFKSLSWVNEIVVVNIGSSDKTLKIAENYGCKIIKGANGYNFSKWRNQGAKAASGKWLLYIDTDERATKELKKEILRLSRSEINGYYIPRKNYFLGKNFRSTWPDYQLRLIKKNALVKWEGNIHETPIIKGKTGKLKNPLIHLSHRTLDTSISNTLKWSWLEAKNRKTANHPKMTGARFLRILFTGLFDQFVSKKIWKEGTEGFIEGIYQSFSLFFTYVRLWELQRKESLEETYNKIDEKITSI